MRLRYKASVVIACFAIFYVGITPIGVACVDPANNCTFLTELTISTRLVVPGNAILEYSGTAQGIEDPKFEYFIPQNVSFLAMMVIDPSCIIGVIVLSEKRKIST